MTLDVRTLVAVLALTQLLQVVVLSVQYAVFRSYRGTGAFLLWSASVGAGSACLLARDYPGLGKAAIFAQNGLLVFGVLCLWSGLCRFHDRTENRGLFAAILGTYLAAHAFFLFVVEDIDARAVALCAAFVVTSGVTVRELWIGRKGASRTVPLVLAAGFLGHAAFFAWRAAALLGGARVDDVWGATFFNAAPYVDALVLSSLVTFGLVIMVNQRVLSEVREARDHLELLLETIPDAVLITRLRDAVCLDVNAGFEALTGLRRADVVGRTSAELGVWADAAVREAVVAEIRAAGQVRDFEFEGKRRDGSSFVGSVSARLVDARGEPHVLSITHDVTAAKAAREALERSAGEILELNAGLERRVEERTAELTEKNREMESLVHSIAHDLRAPLRAIDGFTGILEEEHADRLDADGRRLLGRVRGNAQRMDRLLRDLLSYARACSAGLRPEAVDLGALARRAVEESAAVETRKGLRVTIGEIPRVRGDAALLDVVLKHLLSNAVKYTAPRAERCVEIRGRTEGRLVTCEVLDNGVGFDPVHAKQLFGVFQRLHADEGFEGTGIGLAIVRRIIERHGGAVRAEGAVGRGATFSFTLPAAGVVDA